MRLPAGPSAAPQAGRGYAGLLNLDAQPHWTVFLSDFALPSGAVHRLKRQLEDNLTRPLFLRIDQGLGSVKRRLRSQGVDPRTDYLSFHGIVTRHRSVALLHQLFDITPRADLVRVDLPLPECGFRPRFAAHLLRLVTLADYQEQDRISRRFFDLLHQNVPYHVSVRTNGGMLEISDNSAWFELSGRLWEGETRTLPGGEVAYPGNRSEGTFVVDGAVLASPEAPPAAREALRLTRLSGQLAKSPVRLRIQQGQIVSLDGRSRASRVLDRLLADNQRYRVVTEVGISFNRACRRFIHRWPAASNEGRPGVHIGLGGDPDRRSETTEESRPLVHLDLMSANCEVLVNRHPFLRAQSA